MSKYPWTIHIFNFYGFGVMVTVLARIDSNYWQLDFAGGLSLFLMLEFE